MDIPAKVRLNLIKLDGIVPHNRTLVLILQDNPDPDALAAAAGIRLLANQRWQVNVQIVHGGLIGRAENQALVKYLGIRLHPFRRELLEGDKIVLAMLDTQPGFGNNCLVEMPDRVPEIIIDHHPISKESRRAVFTDIRSQYGATSTMVMEYLLAAQLTIPRPIATGLLYGIRSDTQDLGREATKADAAALFQLYPLSNRKILSQIVRAPVPHSYFSVFSRGLANARVYRHCLYSDLGEIHIPDMVPELADWLLRHDETTWVYVCGSHDGKLYLSLRTTEDSPHAGEVMRAVVSGFGRGGGHESFAGGQINLRMNPALKQITLRQLKRELLLRLLENLKIDVRRGRALF
ncbi:MAG: phosphoesterase [Lentisphaerae bacterium]|nr:MAG: phosphoesterase [Lentisphaerota bacterium]